MHIHPMSFRLLTGVALLASWSAYAADQTGNALLSPTMLPYPSVDSELGEQLYPDEQLLAQEIGAVIERSTRKEYRPGSARRNVHAKAHGCVKAEFQVLDTLPDGLVKGIFVPGKTYHSWIRFSNGSKDATRADRKGDARGMAIKVLGVPGKMLVEDEVHASSLDVIMINHPVFFANDPSRYLPLMKSVNSDSSLKKLSIPFSLGIKGSLIALETGRKKSPILCKPVTGQWFHIS